MMVSCKKDKVPSCIISSCENFEELPPINFFSETRYQFKFPSINPNNNNQILVNFFDNDLSDYKLIVYDISTNQNIDLVSNVKLVTRAKWSNSGRIAFDNFLNNDYQIKIVNNDGSNLMQITNPVHNIFPVWNYDGTELFYQHSPVLGVPYFFKRYSISTTITDTVLYSNGVNNGFVGMSDVNNNNQILAITGIDNKVYLAVSDIANIDLIGIIEMSPAFETFYPTGLCWSNDNIHAYITIANKGLYRINVVTKNVNHLMEFCDTKKYKNISCSSDGTYLIAERVDSELISNSSGEPTGEISQSSFVYKIDLATLNETKIEI